VTAAAIDNPPLAINNLGLQRSTFCCWRSSTVWSDANQLQWELLSRRNRCSGRRHARSSGAAAGAVIFFEGYALSHTGDALAAQTGLGAGMVGFVLIGTSTSLPELSTIYAAARIRRYDMAIGQVLGTDFVNLSLIVLVDGVYLGRPAINQLGDFEIVSSLLGVTLIGVFL
jgi:hypothetical protein